jgi:hypothetical protein
VAAPAPDLCAGGLSLFFLSVGEPTDARVTASALLLGGGIVSMHYVGIHGLAGAFTIEHEHAMVVVAALIAVGTAYGGLRIFLARQMGRRLALSAVAFGFAASGMHYTAMYGMHFRAAPELADRSSLVACRPGRSRRPRRSSIRPSSCGCIAVISLQFGMSASCARKATAPSSNSTARHRTKCR